MPRCFLLMILAEWIGGIREVQNQLGEGKKKLRIQKSMVRLLKAGWNYLLFYFFYRVLIIQNLKFFSIYLQMALPTRNLKFFFNTNHFVKHFIALFVKNLLYLKVDAWPQYTYVFILLVLSKNILWYFPALKGDGRIIFGQIKTFCPACELVVFKIQCLSFSFA